MTTVAIIGPGRVGTLLAVAFARASYRVVAVAGGSARARHEVSSLVAGVRPVDDLSEAAARAELLVVAVPDGAIEPVVTELVVEGGLDGSHRVVHVAGSLGLEPLRRAAAAGARTAACHPAMTVPSGAVDPELLIGTPWGLTAGHADRTWARTLVTDLGGDPHDVPADRRLLYHAGLTLGSNAAGAAVAAARQLLIAARIDDPRVFLDPLVQASVRNASERGAVALTGPVVRGDLGTVAAHLTAIAEDLPALVDAYRALTAATLSLVRPSLSEEVAAAMEAIVADGRED
jgi:predicted short-subunit dehydrogenase-like oxidoreductase (DUF2520 family)